MKFAAYVPKIESGEKLSFLIWLSGLTCNEQNFITKSGFHRFAQKHKICVIAPDTSPSKKESWVGHTKILLKNILIF